MSEAPSLRETLESAISASAEEAPDVVEAPVEAEAASEHAEAEPQETAAEAAQRARDEKGRFAPKPPEKAAEKPTEKPAAPPKGVEKADPGKAAAAVQGKPAGTATPPVPAGPPAPEVSAPKVPQSFRPAVRELAHKLPAEFRPILDEAVRIDNDAKRALNDSTQARQFASQVQESLRPYEGIARASGVDAMTWAGQALQTFAGLHQGTPQHRAAIIAQAISAYGVDVEAVNAIMQGQAPQAHAAPQPQDVSKLVQQEWERRMEEARQQKAAQAWQEFQAAEPEFLEQVKPAMQEILHLAGVQKRNMTYQEAYDRACKLDEEVSGILAARKSAEAARAQAPTVQRAKVAASSIRATPVAAVTRPTGPRSLREDIEAAIAAQRA